MQNRLQKIAAVALAATMAFGMPAGTALAKDDLVRLDGATRYDTMAKIATKGFSSSTYAIVATGSNYPDALAASALAGAKECPIVLTKSNELTPQARQTLQNLRVSRIFVVGGTNAIDDATFEALKQIAPNVARLSGNSRVETSVALLNEVIANENNKKVIVASGNNFADALSISPFAYANKIPIVLTNSDGELTADAVQAIKDAGIRSGVVVGGNSALNFAKIKEQLGFGPLDLVQIAGNNRYETAKKVVEYEIEKGMRYDYATVATGESFPDALAGGVLSGSKNSVLVLTDGWRNDCLNLLLTNAYSVDECYILGGTNAVSTATQSVIDERMYSSDYFERINPDGTNTRFEKVYVRLTGKESKEITFKPGDYTKVMYSDDKNSLDVDFSYRRSDTKVQHVTYTDVTKISVSSDDHELIVTFVSGGKTLRKALTRVINNSGVLSLSTSTHDASKSSSVETVTNTKKDDDLDQYYDPNWLA